jgi:apolipoprotein N-acyltransferase
MSKRPFRISPFNLALALAGGMAMHFAFGLAPVAWLAWFAPAPVLIAALRSMRREALILILLAGLIAASANFHFYQVVMPLAPALLFTVLHALAWTLPLSRGSAALLAWPDWRGLLAYPVLWAGLDTLMAHLLPDGNWISPAYSQAGFLPAAQIVSVAGVPALAFVLALVPSAIALLMLRGIRDRVGWVGLGAAALITSACIGSGQARLAAPSVSSRTLVGLAAIDDFIGPRKPLAAKERVWSQYERHIARLAHDGAQLVVLPEKIAVLDPQAAAGIRDRMAKSAAASHVWLMVGIGIDDGSKRENIAWLFTPGGHLADRYQKHHLAPPEREFVPGTDFSTRTIGEHTYGLAICKDMHFSGMGLSYARRGADVLLVPAWDFGEDGIYEARLSALRGLESGFSMVRNAREGMMTVTDPYGRVRAETRSAPMPGKLLMSTVPGGGPVRTAYSVIGDAFGWACVALCLPLVLLGRRKVEKGAALTTARDGEQQPARSG